MAQIKLIKGLARPDTLQLREEVTLGSQPDAAVVLTDPYVAPEHAVISTQGPEYLLQAHATAPPILLNEVPLTQPQVLQHGDVIRLGLTMFEVGLEAASTTDLVGQVYGERYQLKEQLHCTAYTTFWRAVDLVLQRDMLLYRISPGLSRTHPQLVEQLKQLILPLGQFYHDHIAHLYDFGQQDATYYLVYHLAGTELLSQWLQGGRPLPIERILFIAQALAKALYVLPQAWQPCRLQPANILVNEKRVMLLGVGVDNLLAQFTADGITGASVLDEYRYLAPEQLARQGLTPATDFYRLGLLMGEMSWGQPYLSAPGPAQLIEQLQQTSPPNLNLNQSALLPKLEHIMQQLLARDPQQRYANPHQLLQDLETTALIYQYRANFQPAQWIQLLNTPLFLFSLAPAVGLLLLVLIYCLKG